MKPSSKRFIPSTWTERIVPIVLGLLALALAFTIILISLSVLGAFPGK